MSGKLPVVNAGKMDKLLKGLGYVQRPCTGGSHVNYARPDGKGLIITVPHPKSRELRRGTLKQMARFISMNDGIPEDKIFAMLK